MDAKIAVMIVAAALAAGLLGYTLSAAGEPETVTVTVERPVTRTVTVTQTGGAARTVTVTQTETVTETVTQTVTETVTAQANIQQNMMAKFQEELQRECSVCHPVPEGVQPLMPWERPTVTFEGKVLLANDELAVLQMPNGSIIHVARLPKICDISPGVFVAGEGLEMMVKPESKWFLVKADTCEIVEQG